MPQAWIATSMHTGKWPRAKSVHSNISEENINRKLSIRVEAEEKTVRKTSQFNTLQE